MHLPSSKSFDFLCARGPFFLLHPSGFCLFTFSFHKSFLRFSSTFQLGKVKKGKATPVTGCGSSEGCETSRLPHFLDNRLTDDCEIVSRKIYIIALKFPLIFLNHPCDVHHWVKHVVKMIKQTMMRWREDIPQAIGTRNV
jgi:hypothetical protein